MKVVFPKIWVLNFLTLIRFFSHDIWAWLTTKQIGKKNSLWQLYIGTRMTHQGWHFDLHFMKSSHVFAFITCGRTDIFANIFY